MRQIFLGSTAPKYLTDAYPSNILGVYNPKNWTDAHPSNILGVYSPQMFDGHTSFKHFGSLQPRNI